MSATEDDPTDHADSRKRGYIDSQLTWNMYFYGREVCFFLAIIFTSYAALQNAPPKVSKILPAIPFFPRDSPVADFFQGELSPAFEKISESDLSFVMYYAPWDAESQSVKIQFDILASYYKDQIFFAAVNCWHPTGECRRHFAKVQQFPVLIAYPALRGKGVQYRGIRRAPHMARFLQTAIKPLTRVEASSDVLSLMASHDAVAVGCVDLPRRGRGYQALYTAALRALEKDPFQEVAFAVATSRAACLRLGNSAELQMPLMRLYLWNETLVYGGEWTGDGLVRWVFSSIHQVAVWVSLPGTKALSLSPYVEEGPAVLMFTPRNPFFSETPYFELLREVGLEYYNCNNNTWVQNMAHFLKTERAARKQRHRNAEKACFSPLLSESATTCQATADSTTCATLAVSGEANLTTPSPVEGTADTSKVPGTCWTRHCHALWHCENDPWNAEDCLIPSIGEIPPSVVGNITSQTIDDRVLQLGKDLRNQRCHRLLLGRRLQRAVFPRKSFDDALERLNGLACTNNRSLSLLALDSLEFAPLAKQLGVDVLTKPDRTAVIIFNAGQESQHVLEGAVTKLSLAQFLINHTFGDLPRSLRSLTLDTTACQEGSVCIPELDSHTFLPTILNNDKDVVVLYHTSYCGLCGAASLAFLNVARLFRHTPHLEFARIDGENHDLPWEFTMDLYPTIIFFPAARKAESRVFPRTKPVTMETVTQFVLANLQPESRLETLLGLQEGSQMACLHTLVALNEISAQRRHCYSRPTSGSTPLLRWRRLLQRAQYLRLLHLALISPPLQKEATFSLHRYYALPSPGFKAVISKPVVNTNSKTKTATDRDEL